MNPAIRAIVAGVVAIAVIIIWSICMAASATDEHAKQMQKEYLKWKRRKEKNKE